MAVDSMAVRARKFQLYGETAPQAGKKRAFAEGHCQIYLCDPA